jgi:hypothetical protein
MSGGNIIMLGGGLAEGGEIGRGLAAADGGARHDL